jgi:hypothetical protein
MTHRQLAVTSAVGETSAALGQKFLEDGCARPGGYGAGTHKLFVVIVAKPMNRAC